jgi:hypothetical protein
MKNFLIWKPHNILLILSSYTAKKKIQEADKGLVRSRLLQNSVDVFWNRQTVYDS